MYYIWGWYEYWGAENGRFTIDVGDDGTGINQDFMQIASSGGVSIWRKFSQTLTLPSRDFEVIRTFFFDASASFSAALNCWGKYDESVVGTDIELNIMLDEALSINFESLNRFKREKIHKQNDKNCFY